MTLDLLILFLVAAGLATLALGVVHLILPRLYDLETAVPLDGAPLRPLPLIGDRYATRRQDVRGIVWVSNNAASYVLLTLGILDLAATSWLATPAGRLLALWAAGWWLVRAVSQLAIGRRSGDLAFVIGFLVLGVVHLAAAAR